jgi:carbonic anhydrase
MAHGESTDEPDAGAAFESVERRVDERDDWARRRRSGIPTNKQLLVIACMDERIPVEEALGIELGDAQIPRNAGGKVTDDIDSACAEQVRLLEDHPLIPDDTVAHGYVYEVESGALRRPGERIAEEISERVAD